MKTAKKIQLFLFLICITLSTNMFFYHLLIDGGGA